MKKIELLFVISLLVGAFLVSCNKEKTENPIVGEIIEHSDCKDYNSKSYTQIDDYGSDTAYVSYSYNLEEKKLTLKHINACFNCCPDKLFCNIEILNDTIKIKEKEEKTGCNCNCLYDLDINVANVELQKYNIVIDEPYLGNQKEIVFEIDLTINKTGVFIISRTEYPWGI